MVNQVQAFIAAVRNNNNEKDLLDVCKKWLNEHAEKTSAADCERILSTMALPRNTLGYLCALVAKLRRIKSQQAELLTFVGAVGEALFEFDNKQIQLCPEIYHRLFEELVNALLRANRPAEGVELLSLAVRKLTNDTPSRLTELHSSLLALCLKARYFDAALPFLELDPTKLFNRNFQPLTDFGTADGIPAKGGKAMTGGASGSESEKKKGGGGGIFSAISKVIPAQLVPDPGSSSADNEGDFGGSASGLLKTRSTLLYFYYGSMVLAALERYEESLSFLEQLLCLPAVRPSAIIIEGAKKYVLISLIVGRNDPFKARYLPSYRPAVLMRFILPLIEGYTKLITIHQKAVEGKRDVADAVNKYINSNRQLFVKDSNLGLARRVVTACEERAIKRLPKIFLTLKRGDLARYTFLSAEGAETVMHRLLQRGELNVRFDQAKDVYYFEEAPPPELVDAAQCMAKLDEMGAEMAALGAKIKDFDDAIRLNPTYMKRAEKGGSGRPGGGFPDDEGFQAIGVSSTSPPPILS